MMKSGATFLSLPTPDAEPPPGDTHVLRTFVRHVDGMVYRMRHEVEWVYEYVSAGCETLTGYTASELQVEGRIGFTGLVHPDDQFRVQQEVELALARRERYELEYRVQGADGLLRWVSDRGAGLYDAQGRTRGAEGILQDITHRILAFNAAREAERRYRGLFEHAIEGIFRTTPEGRYLAANPALARIYGFESAEELIGSLQDIRRQLYVNPQRREEFMSLIRGRGSITSFESQIYRKDGSIIWISENARAVHDPAGVLQFYEGTVEDITERKLYEARLERQANYDALTGLANRTLFQDRLEQAILTPGSRKHGVAVVFIDLDRFKFINDSLGHQVGDELLKTMAERLQGSVRDCDTVARLGGDEFVLLINGHSGAEAVRDVVDTVIGTISQPWVVEHGEFSLTCSIGVALFPEDGRDAAALLKNADSAMYRAKELGRNTCQFFTSELNARLAERLELQQGLTRALEREQFKLRYQPRINMRTSEIVGAEALLRWTLPNHGMVPPARFIPIAEETGLIVPIGRWVLEHACLENRRWQKLGLPPMVIAVNVSAPQFQQQNFVRTVAEVLASTGMDPQYLELEMTESMVMHEAGQLIASLNALKDLGVHLSIDDFGTGYSSLSYLKRFPVDRLKIDRSFVMDLATDPDDATIVRAIIALGHNLGLKVVAEGVETVEQATFLSECGCDEAQGYYYSQPVTEEAIIALLHSRPE
ncbi:MAG TPA: EAL domain-containing protein [Steroidobacteraceae bacterium]|nr:EAL domain-containing protein [Steroidobacteraceae bacterium]